MPVNHAAVRRSWRTSISSLFSDLKLRKSKTHDSTKNVDELLEQEYRQFLRELNNLTKNDSSVLDFLSTNYKKSNCSERPSSIFRSSSKILQHRIAEDVRTRSLTAVGAAAGEQVRFKAEELANYITEIVLERCKSTAVDKTVRICVSGTQVQTVQNNCVDKCTCVHAKTIRKATQVDEPHDNFAQTELVGACECCAVKKSVKIVPDVKKDVGAGSHGIEEVFNRAQPCAPKVDCACQPFSRNEAAKYGIVCPSSTSHRDSVYCYDPEPSRHSCCRRKHSKRKAKCRCSSTDTDVCPAYREKRKKTCQRKVGVECPGKKKKFFSCFAKKKKRRADHGCDPMCPIVQKTTQTSSTDCQMSPRCNKKLQKRSCVSLLQVEPPCTKCGKPVEQCRGGATRNTIVVPPRGGGGLASGEGESIRLLIKLQNKNTNRQFDNIMAEIKNQKSEIRRLNDMYSTIVKDGNLMRPSMKTVVNEGTSPRNNCYCPNNLLDYKMKLQCDNALCDKQPTQVCPCGNGQKLDRKDVKNHLNEQTAESVHANLARKRNTTSFTDTREVSDVKPENVGAESVLEMLKSDPDSEKGDAEPELKPEEQTAIGSPFNNAFFLWLKRSLENIGQHIKDKSAKCKKKVEEARSKRDLRKRRRGGDLGNTEVVQ